MRIISLVIIFVTTSLALADRKADLGGKRKSEQPAFYSVEPIVQKINKNDLGSVRDLDYPTPAVLYHWLTIKSLKRLFANGYEPFPLKILGSETYQSRLARNAPAFFNVPGLFAWHNPIGASSGGSGEMYGNHEAVLALKIAPDAKLGLVITKNDIFQTGRAPPKALHDTKLHKPYDLILHMNAIYRQGEVRISYMEWVLLNPNVVTAVSADPNISIDEMDRYREALRELTRKHPNSVDPFFELAGSQHSYLGTEAIDDGRIKDLQSSLHDHARQILKVQRPLANGWRTLTAPISCHSIMIGKALP